MLDFVLYMVFSILETYAMFYLAFKVFKIDIYPKEMLFAGVLMAFVSYVLRNDYELILTDVALQYLLTFCFLWLLFRIHIFYAVSMTGLTYLAYMLIQSTSYFILKLTGLYYLDLPYTTMGVFILQFISAISAMITGFYIGKKRKGFDFVPDKQNVKVNIELREIKIFILSAPSLIFVILMVILTQRYSQYFFLMPMVYAVLLYAYLYLSYKKDRTHNEFIS
ncbi:hypothetical protein HQN87_06390 [Paenibacillus tritici]|uniref:Uncharacterized protein n=1 Tax=Paenibacillus tritici TaxID=1873425 RepID=A0ABX2DK14_9BACL|nr:hypothetical protein [Paenibacillus tritici]NQX44952.1 hypothetical protein [Paenibacillus tritici]